MKQSTYKIHKIFIISTILLFSSQNFLCNIFLNPESEKILLNQANKLQKQNKFDEAIEYYQKILKSNPNNIKACFFIGYIFHNQQKLDKALKFYLKTLEIDPNCYEALRNSAILFKQKEMPEQAIKMYKRILDMRPNDYVAHCENANALLSLGNFEKGWKETLIGRRKHLKKLDKLLINKSQIPESTILITSNWGLGDMLQFIRFAKLIKKSGGKVIVLSPNPLEKILSSCKYIDEITTKKPDKSYYDFQTPIWNLPYIFKITENNIPNKTPYLYANPQLVYHWKNKLKKDKNFKIGICWKGTSILAYKDIPLKKFETISQIPGISLYSLQKGNGIEQIDKVNFKINNFSMELDENNGPFMDTAALIKNMDLVISIDTSIAHLAGALNIPVWVPIPFSPDWRWMLNRSDTPWYKTMKLFRGTKRYYWDDVIEKITYELEKIVNI